MTVIDDTPTTPDTPNTGDDIVEADASVEDASTAETADGAEPAGSSRRRPRPKARTGEPTRRQQRRRFLARRRGTIRARVGVGIRTLAASLLRNGPLTLAAILSSAVALTLVGAAMVTSYGVDNATMRWRDGVETIVFMDPNASTVAVEAVEAALVANPDVETVRVVDKTAAWDEFQEMFANTPDLVETVRPDALPVSLRISPAPGVSETAVDQIGESVAEMGGVWQIVYARDTVRSVLQVSTVIRYGLGVLAVVLGAVAALLTYASCRAAAYARRDELAIMRTMGAPRWLVRLPFIGEGLFAGLTGALVAVGVTWALGRTLNTRVADGEALAILRNFSVSADQLWRTTIVLVVAGAAGGAIGAAAAIGRWVRVGDGTGRLPSRALRRLVRD